MTRYRGASAALIVGALGIGGLFVLCCGDKTHEVEVVNADSDEHDIRILYGYEANRYSSQSLRVPALGVTRVRFSHAASTGYLVEVDGVVIGQCGYGGERKNVSTIVFSAAAGRVRCHAWSQ